MSQFSMKSFRNYLVTGGAVGLLYLIFSHDSVWINRIINSLFMGSMIPLLWGAVRFIKGAGTFDLFVYSHRKIWKYGKKHEEEEEENEKIAPGTTEQLGSYYDYLTAKERGPSCREPLAAGAIYLAVSIVLTILIS